MIGFQAFTNEYRYSLSVKRTFFRIMDWTWFTIQMEAGIQRIWGLTGHKNNINSLFISTHLVYGWLIRL